MTPDQQILIQSALNGILIGSLFGIMGMGLSLEWGLLKIANFAHFSLTLLAAYLTYSLTVSGGFDPLMSLLVVVPVSFVLGAAMQWVFERFRVTTFTSLLLTFGVFIVVENFITYIWTADIISIRREIDPIYRQAIRLPPPLDRFLVFPPDLIAFAAALLIAVALYILLHRTMWGRAVRAMAQDPLIARAFGVNQRRAALFLAGVAGATAGVAGMVVALKLALYPSMALTWIGIVVAAVIIGGLGKPLGALIAASALSMVENIWSVTQPPAWAPLISFSILVLVLFIQPRAFVSALRRLPSRSVVARTKDIEHAA